MITMIGSKKKKMIGSKKKKMIGSKKKKRTTMSNPE